MDAWAPTIHGSHHTSASSELQAFNTSHESVVQTAAAPHSKILYAGAAVGSSALVEIKFTTRRHSFDRRKIIVRSWLDGVATVRVGTMNPHSYLIAINWRDYTQRRLEWAINNMNINEPMLENRQHEMQAMYALPGTRPV